MAKSKKVEQFENLVLKEALNDADFSAPDGSVTFKMRNAEAARIAYDFLEGESALPERLAEQADDTQSSGVDNKRILVIKNRVFMNEMAQNNASYGGSNVFEAYFRNIVNKELNERRWDRDAQAAVPRASLEEYELPDHAVDAHRVRVDYENRGEDNERVIRHGLRLNYYDGVGQSTRLQNAISLGQNFGYLPAYSKEKDINHYFDWNDHLIISGGPMLERLAHYGCEIAEQAIKNPSYRVVGEAALSQQLRAIEAGKAKAAGKTS